MQLFKKVGDILLITVLILLVLTMLITVLSGLYGDARMMLGGYTFGRIATGSMEPDIPTGSFVLVKAVDENTLVIGDVIMFHSDDPEVPAGLPVSHAVSRITRDDIGTLTFYTKGTANTVEDLYPVHADDIIGKVIFHSTAIGAIVSMIQQPWVYPVLISVLLLDLIYQIVVVIIQARALQKNSNSTQN